MIRRPAALFLLALATTACSRRESVVTASAAGVKSRALTPVTLNLRPSMTFAAIMIAKEEKFFEQEGIEPRIVEVDGEQLALATTSGAVDVMSISLRPGVFNTALRAPVRIVADKGHSRPGPCAAEAFAAPKATVARIRQRGFRGERFVRERGTFTEYLVATLLRQEGLTENDVEFAELGNTEAVAAMQDRLDAVLYSQEPKLSNLLSKGRVEIIRSSESVVPGHQFSVLAFGNRLLHEEPEVGHRFMRAYLRGVRQYNQGKTDRNVEILAKYTKLPPEIIRRSCWIAIRSDGRVPPEGVQGFLDWAKQSGYLDADIAVSQWWDGRFAEAASTALDQKERSRS